MEMFRTWLRKPELPGLHYMRVRGEVDSHPVLVRIEIRPDYAGSDAVTWSAIDLLSSGGKFLWMVGSPERERNFNEFEFLPVPDPAELESLLALGEAAREFLDHCRRAAGVVTDWVRRNHIELAQWVLAQAVFEIGKKWRISHTAPDGGHPSVSSSAALIPAAQGRRS